MNWVTYWDSDVNLFLLKSSIVGADYKFRFEGFFSFSRNSVIETVLTDLP